MQNVIEKVFNHYNVEKSILVNDTNKLFHLLLNKGIIRKEV